MKIKYQISDIKNTNQISKISGKFLFLHFIFAFLFLLFNFHSAFAWKLPLEVSTVSDDGKKVYNKLVVGIESGATDGFDNLWDTPALVSNPDSNSPVLLHAYLKNDMEAREDLHQLWKDIRGTIPNGSHTIWDIAVDSVPAGKSVVIHWDIPAGVIGKGERLVLKDNNKIGTDNNPVQVDLTQTTEYSFVSGDGEARSLSLTLTKPKSSRSKSSSGFGCGTVKNHNDDSGKGNGSAETSVVLLLLLPVLFSRVIRLTRLRLYI